MPRLAITRFSPSSGTASATVAITSIFRNDGSSFSRARCGVDAASSSAWASLNATPAPQRCLQGYAQSGWLGLRIGERLRQAHCGLGQVVVGDDQIEVEARGFVRGGEGADAGIHADDEAHAFGRGAREHLGLHAVAVAQAMRDVIADSAAEDLDGGLEQDDGGGAVHVVVAVDEDRLARRDGLLDARDRGGHAVQRIGVEQVVERRDEGSARLRSASATPRWSSREATGMGTPAEEARAATAAGSSEGSSQCA